MKCLKWVTVATIMIWLTGCNGCFSNKSREKPDVSGNPLRIHLLRFDQDLFGFGKNDYQQQLEMMRNKYGSFFDFYVDHIVIGPHPVGDTMPVLEDALKKFISDSYIRRIQDSINFHFKKADDVEQDLTQAFKYTQYYLPKMKIPKVIGINSGFALGAFTYGKDDLGIGLDLYFGSGNIDYDSAGIFKYLQHKMKREYMARNAVEVLYNLYFIDEDAMRGKTLVEAMTEKGKKMYFLSMIFPDAPDSMILGFTNEQVNWCAKNEYEIWKYLNGKDILYKSDYMDQKRYLDEGPTTPGMPAESPGNIGSWIGLQIVRKFMRETDNKVSLHELIVKYDSKTILAKARYRPSKSFF